MKGRIMKLRKLKPNDAYYMLEWMHDNDITCNLKNDFEHKTLDDCMEFIALANKEEADMHLAIADEEDEYMGTVSLKNINDHSAEFAIAIRKCAMGKGYAHDAMDEILNIGFEKRGLALIYWCVDPANIRAIKFYDKNGYTKVTPDDIRESIQGYTEDEIIKMCWYLESR